MKGILLCLFIAGIFLYSLLRNITKPLSLTHGDAFLVNFILQHWMRIFSTGNWANAETLPMFYGFPHSLFFTDHHIMQAVLVLPFFLLMRDIITATNLLYLLTVCFSLASMYLFVRYITHNELASVIGSLLFVFNPYVMGRFPDHLILVSLQWIPLIFLSFEKWITGKQNRWGFLFFLFLTCQLLSSLYYSVFLTVILPFYAIIRMRQERTTLLRVVSKPALLGFALFIIVTGISASFYIKVNKTYSIGRDLNTTVVSYSPWLADMFFTNPSNILYGRLKQLAAKKFPNFVQMGIDSEHNLFWGITPFALLCISLVVLRNSPWKKTYRVWVLLLLCSLLLSFGPRFNASFTLSFPNPLYLIIANLNMLFGFLRTPGRFTVFVFFFLALLCSATYAHLAKGKTRFSQRLLAGIIFFLMLEYWTKPLEFLTIDRETETFYRTVNSQNQVQVILDLPIANRIDFTFRQARSEDSDTHYLLWATILHDKTLLNGNSGFFPDEYYRRAALLSIDFPTNQKIALLQKWGAGAIVLHKDEYTDPKDYELLSRRLQDLSVPVIAETDRLAAFDLTRWQPEP